MDLLPLIKTYMLASLTNLKAFNLKTKLKNILEFHKNLKMNHKKNHQELDDKQKSTAIICRNHSLQGVIKISLRIVFSLNL